MIALVLIGRLWRLAQPQTAAEKLRFAVVTAVAAFLAGLTIRSWFAEAGAVTSTYLAAAVGGVAAAGILAALGRAGARTPSEPAAPSLDVVRRFRRHRLAASASIVLAVLVELALLAGVIALVLGISHEATSLADRYQAPGFPHLLGTDDLGRDVLLRLLFGGQISLAVGLVAALSSAIVGSSVGLLAGWYGGRVDGVLMRFTDAMLGVPVLPLMIVLSAIDLNVVFGGGASVQGAILVVTAAAVLGGAGAFFQKANAAQSAMAAAIVSLPLAIAYVAIWELLDDERLIGGNLASVIKLVLIITLFGWMTVARLARASALQLKALDFVVAARALGAGDVRILVRHLLPNALAPLIVAATLEVGGNILYEAALSFLGLGIQPPVPSWGNMLNNALDYIKREPVLAFWPGLLILTTVTCFNFIGDGLRDALDPHQLIRKG
jgi:peptide/nickel transport system permease protein